MVQCMHDILFDTISTTSEVFGAQAPYNCKASTNSLFLCKPFSLNFLVVSRFYFEIRKVVIFFKTGIDLPGRLNVIQLYLNISNYCYNNTKECADENIHVRYNKNCLVSFIDIKNSNDVRSESHICLCAPSFNRSYFIAIGSVRK